MTMQNADIADIFNHLADLLEIEGSNVFRVRAYRNAARTVAELPHPISEMVTTEQPLTGLPGIGKELAAKIVEIVQTGALSKLTELEKKTPPDLPRLLKIANLGPKRVKALRQALGISSLDELKKAALAGEIRHVVGFGPKTEASILQSLETLAGQGRRFPLFRAEQRADDLVAFLKSAPGVDRVIVAGSLRRRMETVGDLDILVTCRDAGKLMAHFVSYEDIRSVVSQGDTRSTVVLRSGMQVDVRAVPQVSYGAALHYFTGSKDHNVAVRRRAVRKGLKINEYGVFQGQRRIAGETEESVYARIGLPYIEPELRENRGELQAAEEARLPRLIEARAIQGDLHAHTLETDGKASLEDMARAARAFGYRYLGITEHSRKVAMARGMNARRLARHIERIDRLNETFDDFVLLKGIEVDILEDGALDLPAAILAKLDYRICSVHYYQNLSREKQTDRILRAVENPLCTILGHPTGRLIGRRKPYEVDMERIMRAAARTGCVMELNAHPERLDLNDLHCRMAKQMGVRLAISTDAHSTADLYLMRCGIDQARRGWIEAQDVINTRNLKQLMRIFAER
jgi:DNA polymerase (family 10)